MAEIIGISLAIFGVGYAIKSALTAKRDLRKNKGYRDAVIEYTVKRGHSIQNNYNKFEKKIENGEVTLNNLRNPENNESYNTLKRICEEHINEIENSNDDYGLLENEPLV